MKKVITANTLKTGEVAFLGSHGWVSGLSEAWLFDADDGLDDIIVKNRAPDHVIGLYAIDVTQEEGGITPVHIREKIRVEGPGNYAHHRRGDISPMRASSAPKPADLHSDG
jgi:hypothetical protein